MRLPAMLLCLGWLTCAGALADNLASLPPPWAQRLEPVPEMDLQGAEPLAREAIRTARATLDRLLADAHTPAEKLAAAWGRLAALYQLAGIDRGARIAWDNARRLEPERFRWAYYAGYHALERGELDRAAEAFAAAARLKPDDPPLALQRGRLAMAQGRLNEAEHHLQQAAAHEGLRAAALYYLGQIALLRHAPELAVKHLEESLRLAPDADGIHYALARAWRMLGDREKAQAHMARFRHKEPPPARDPLVAELEDVLHSARTRFRLGMEAVRQRDYAAAAARFRDGLEREPDNRHARVSLARVLFLSGKREEAETLLRELTSRPDAPPLARFLLAVLEEGRGHMDAARRGYESVLRQDPDHPGAHYQLAHLLMRTGHHAEAAREYERALKADPRITPARLLAVIARARAGAKEREILQRLERLHARHPEDPRVTLALVRLRALAKDPAVRNPARALELANQLAPAHPSPPHIEALALAAAADGQFETAARLEKQAIGLMAWQAPPETLATAQRRLKAYEGRRLPSEPPFPVDDPLFAPPPLDVTVVFRDYPAARPY